MKIIISSFFIMGGFIHSYSQVGIGTETPTRMLDVNGNIRVTQLNDKTNTVDFEQLVAAMLIIILIKFLNLR